MRARSQPLSALLWRALTLRCPHCGIGRPLRRWFSVEPVCGHCGLKMQREPGYFVGAIYISYFLAVLPVVIGIFVLPRFISLPIVWQLALWMSLALLLSLTTVRIGRSLWLAIDYFFDPWEPDDPTSSLSGPDKPLPYRSKGVLQ